MEFRDYLLIVRRKWLSIAAATVLGILAAVGINLASTPEYESEAQLFISANVDNSTEAYQAGLLAQQRAQSYADMVNGQELSRQVVEELGLDISPEALASKITASSVADTVLINVTVRDTNATRAQQINRAALEQLQEAIADIETPEGRDAPLVKASITDPPQVPTDPVSPKPGRNLALGAALGVVLGLLLAITREAASARRER